MRQDRGEWGYFPGKLRLPPPSDPFVRAATAQIHPSARLAGDVTVGHFCVIEADVEIGAGSVLGHHVVVREGSRLGAELRVDDHAVIGKQPMRAARSATTRAEPLPPAEVGAGSLIGTGAVLYAGCTIGQRVLMADYATIRERVTVGDETIVGRGVAIENDCTVGARCKLETNAYITALSTVEDDVFIAPGVLTSNDNFMGRTEARKQHFGGPTIRRVPASASARSCCRAATSPRKRSSRPGRC